MSSRLVSRFFWVALLFFFAAFLFEDLVISRAMSSHISLTTALVLFLLSIAMEIVALLYCVKIRKQFQPTESNYRIWTVFTVFFVVLILAEFFLFKQGIVLIVRLFLHLAPTERSGICIFALPYLYPLSYIILSIGLGLTILNYKATCLPFKILLRDYIYIVLLCGAPLAAILLGSEMAKDFLMSSTTGKGVATPIDKSQWIFRLVDTSAVTLQAMLCVVVRRYVIQMGRGKMAKIWTAVWIAGIVHICGHFMSALVLDTWYFGSLFFERYCLWIFISCWLIAVLREKELLGYSSEQASP